MSVDTAVARVSQLQALIDPPRPAAPVAGAGFGAQLAQAAAAQAPAAQTAGAGGAPAGGGETRFDAEIQAAAGRHGLDPALLKALIRAESNFNPNAGSPAGAQGLTQLMPGTARSLGVTDPHDPVQSIEGGARYLAQQLRAFGGDASKALAAYNAGPGAVQRFGGIPPYAETRNYVSRVLEYARGYGYGGGLT